MTKIKITNGDDVSRREFLRVSGGCAALTGMSLVSALLNLNLTQSAVAATSPGGYKALVCLFQHGGNDSYNMLAPTDLDAYAAYQLARGNLALDSASMHQIMDPGDGRHYGIHPGMPELQQRYGFVMPSDLAASR